MQHSKASILLLKLKIDLLCFIFLRFIKKKDVDNKDIEPISYDFDKLL